MGLAAGQARLLTITARKSDCEFESMRLSHQKIALARELADLSNEYQNSMNQSMLIFDYYGTGDTSLELSYGILMHPSSLNDYKPILLTDSTNRVVLNSSYASAAREAGIPQEGLGTLPSEVVRNKFIIALAGEGIISEYTKTGIIGNIDEGIIGVPYNQGAGFGADTQVTTVGKSMNLNDLCEYLVNMGEAANFGSPIVDHKWISDYYIKEIDKSKSFIWNDKSNPNDIMLHNKDNLSDLTIENWTLGDILSKYLNDDKELVLCVLGENSQNNTTGRDGIVDHMCNCNIWDQMFDTFENILNDGSAATEMALLTAREKIEKYLTNPSVGLEHYDNYSVGTSNASWSTSNPDGMNDFDNAARIEHAWDEGAGEIVDRLQNFVGTVGYNVLLCNDDDGDSDNDQCYSGGTISISNMIMAYLTEVYVQLNGVNGGDYHVEKGNIGKNRFIDEECLFTVYDTEVSSEITSYAGFYDTMFNMICKSGWTENNNIEDNTYLRTMLQNGMLYISKQKDDRCYYQNNYATDSYIKEIADETLIARAEANYNTEKAKLNAKEETLDLKMKNLDTEISALTTEYDTVKNTISKQIDKCFKRYNA